MGTDAIERVIECEDLFKGCIALLADRAVHVEERLGACVVKGSYPYGPAQLAVSDEFGGTKEVRLRINGESARFGKVLPADAAEIERRFGSAVKKPEASPGVAPLRLPSPAPQAREKRPPFAFKPIAIDAAKVAGVSAIAAIIARAIFPWNEGTFIAVLHSVAVWTCYGAAAGVLRRAYAPIMIRYALGCAAIEQSVFYVARFIGYGTFTYVFESVAVWALFSAGYFAARGSRAPWQHAAAVGGVFGAFHQGALRNLFGFNGVSIFFALFVFWCVQLVAERHPDSPVKA